MPRKAHNSTWIDGLRFGGEHYPGPKALHASADPERRVVFVTFNGRLVRRREAGDPIDDVLIEDCLYTSPAAYQREHGVRRTWVTLDQRRQDVAILHAQGAQAVSYPTFRQRVIRLDGAGLLDQASLAHAGSLEQPEWISFYGGGRRQLFIYDGEDYPAHAGQRFSSIAAFLRTIDRYEARGHVWDRLNKGWPIDPALSEPILPATLRRGSIYRITQRSTGLVYVGLTISTLAVRWNQHLVAAAKGGTTLLARAIQADGAEGFATDILEDGLAWDDLGVRERHWIAKSNCVAPNGLNLSRGGQIGGGKRKPVEIEGERFSSHEEAFQVIGARTGLPPHVVESRLRSQRPLPAKARTQSKHPEAGSNLWRRRASLINAVKKGVRQGPIDPRWLESYDAYAADVRPTFDPKLEMERLDETKPWGPGNFVWRSRSQRITRAKGVPISAGGKTYESIQALATAYDIGVSTLKQRLGRGMSPDAAVSVPLSATSRKGRAPFVFEGTPYASLSKAAEYAAQRYGISFDTARDRLRRGVPLSRPSPSKA